VHILKKRVHVSVDDELYGWLEKHAAKLGVSVAAAGAIMIHEGRKSTENQAAVRSMLEQFGAMTPEALQRFLTQQDEQMKLI
jgi:hypothetical protein